MSSGDGKTGPVNIRGVAVPSGANPPSRLEIRELKKNTLQWNLYLLGMERFQQVDESDPMSYFQIAGIHGTPYVTWPQNQWNTGKLKRALTTGFCTHSSVLFLPWHRPYLALFEYALHQHVTAVAEEFHKLEGRTDYLDEAKKFRIPYWDWAIPGKTVSTLFPEDSLQNSKPTVTRPGKKSPEPLSSNPLGTYKFQNSQGLEDDIRNGYDGTFKINNFAGTIRYPRARGNGERDRLMQDALNVFYTQNMPAGNRGKNLTERTLYILQSYDKFKPMSNNTIPGQPSSSSIRFDNFGSFEDIHGAVHGQAGGGGHMGWINLSSFDPIFWLHHCNIDRVFSIWQALHQNDSDPNTFVTATPSGTGTWSTIRGGEESEETDLTPFTNNSDKDRPTYWKSKDVKDTKTFGYVYPETQRWKYSSDTQYKQGVTKDIKRLYEGGSLANLASAPETVSAPAIATLNLHAETTLLAASGAFGTNTLEQVTATQADPSIVESVQASIPGDRHPRDLVDEKSKQYTEWLVDVKAQKHALNGHWSIHIFLGKPDDSNPYLYELSPNHVGRVAAMGQGAETACEKCQKDQEEGLTITGQIPLTIALVERYIAGVLPNMDRQEVINYLNENLYWRVMTEDGELITDRQLVTGLLVAVVTNKVTLPANDTSLPIYDPHVEPVPEATSWPQNDGTGFSTQTV